MGYKERKQAEVERKMEALDQEFQRWLKATSEGAKFPRHHRQVRAVIHRLTGIQQAVREALGTETTLSTARTLSSKLLGVHRVWEYFRSKLSQRHESAFEKYLAIADEFAWLCYEPVYARASQAGAASVPKEPPLIYLNGGLSPFILTRDAAFQAEAVPRELLHGDFRQATASLPFPVIGVPWNQVLHLPDALAIGHEVGHSVEADFDLGPALNALIEEALAESGGEQRAGYWKAWRSEIFADVYGCLCGGPPFACALADFLLADPAEVQARRPALTAYPPETLRVRINACVLEKMGFRDPAARLAAAWNAEYTLPEDQSDFAVKDAPAVAARFLDAKLDALGGSLRSAITFTDTQYDQARKQAARASDGRELLDVRDLRVTLAAARIGYAAAPKSHYAANGGVAPAARLEDRMMKLLSSDLRSGEPARSAKQQEQADRYNVEFGRQQAELLLQASI